MERCAICKEFPKISLEINQDILLIKVECCNNKTIKFRLPETGQQEFICTSLCETLGEWNKAQMEMGYSFFDAFD